MALKTKLDTHSFRGILHSKVLGLPLPVVALGAGVVGVILWRRHSAAAGTDQSSSDSTASDAASTGGGYGSTGSGGGAYGGSGGYPVGIPFFPPHRRGRITQRPVRRGVISKTVTTRKDRSGDAIRTVVRRWAGGGVVTRRRVLGSGNPATVTHSTTPRTSHPRPTLVVGPRRRKGSRPRRSNPTPQSIPSTHFGA